MKINFEALQINIHNRFPFQFCGIKHHINLPSKQMLFYIFILLGKSLYIPDCTIDKSAEGIDKLILH